MSTHGQVLDQWADTILELGASNDAIQRVRDLHKAVDMPLDDGLTNNPAEALACQECRTPYPCRTGLALSGTHREGAL